MFGVSRAPVFRWQQKYDAGGPAGLETKKTPGPAYRLSPTQMSQLYAMVSGCDPRQLEFDFGLWTRRMPHARITEGNFGLVAGTMTRRC